ncbi:MAG: AAA family ATPase [Candidatus Pacearchaeota archaeon]
MIIKSIELYNIKSHKKSFIEFPRASILLAGDIGSGKSSILQGLEFGLFGFQRGELEGRNLLRAGTNEGYVKVNFEVNGKKVSIKREIARKKDSFLQSDAWLEIEGKLQRLSVEEINAKVVELLNFPDPKKKNLIYRFTVYTPQEQMKRILLEKPDVRLDILRKIFNIDKYKRVSENLGVYCKELRERIRILKTEVKDIESIRQKINELKKVLQELSGKKQLLEQRLEKEKKLKTTIEISIESLKEESESIEKQLIELNRLKTALNEKKNSLDYIDEEIKSFGEKKIKKREELIAERQILKNKLNSTLQSIEKISDEINKLREEKENISKIIFLNKEKISQLKQEIEASLKLNVCPKCKQQVSEAHKNKVISELQLAIKKSEQIVSEEEEKLKSINSKIKAKEQEADALNKAMRELELKLKDAEHALSQLEAYERKLSLKEKLAKEIAKLQAELAEIKIDEKAYEEKKLEQKKKLEELDKVNTSITSILTEIAGIDEGIRLRSKQLTEEEAQLKQKESLLDKIQKLSLFEAWLSSSFLSIIEKIERAMLYKINKEVGTLLKKWFCMFVDSNIDVALLDDFTPLVEENGYQRDYADLSGGERTALALAYRLALNQLINSLTNLGTKGLIILDEPTEGFSQKQLEKMADVFKEIRAEQLLIVSHDPKIENFVDHIIRLRKENGITSIIRLR